MLLNVKKPDVKRPKISILLEKSSQDSVLCVFNENEQNTTN